MRASNLIILSTIYVVVLCDAGDSSSVDFVKDTVSSHSIVIFSKTYCPFCVAAKKVFKELNTDPYVIELNEREDGSEIQDALGDFVGKRTVPQVFVKGKHIGGSVDTLMAYTNGELAMLIGVDSSAKTEL